jgi:hypothetical protein
MSDWIQNVTTINGNPETLEMIRSTNFDFEKIHPYDVGNVEDRNEWYRQVWGTWEPARDIQIHFDGLSLRATYRTRLSTPHGIFAYLTLHNPDLTIRTTWNRDMIEHVGIATYEKGIITSKSFDPFDFKPSALKRFSAENPWFSYSNYCLYVLEEAYDGDNDENRKPEVAFKEWSMSYHDWLDLNMPR